jgi:ribosomal protein S18 acetylase RimI-like enzyme
LLAREKSVDFEWRYSQKGIDWIELSELYKKVPLADMGPEELEKVFSNSMFKCFVFKSSKLIGVGRALADGLDCSYICHVAVLPEYQGLGVGKSIVSRLVELSKGHKKIILYSNPGKEPFYKKIGFKTMNTAMAIFENYDQAVDRGFINEK